jgi:hypothetical protein
MTRSFARGVNVLLQVLLCIFFSLDLLPHFFNAPFTAWLRAIHIVWWLFGTFVVWIAWRYSFYAGSSRAKTLSDNVDSDSSTGGQSERIDLTKSFTKFVDILLQFTVWMLVLLTILRHVIDTPFTAWLRAVHIFWWFLGSFIVWLLWKHLFCGGFSKFKTQPRD